MPNTEIANKKCYSCDPRCSCVLKNPNQYVSDTRQEILLLEGIQGSGKSSVAKKIATELGIRTERGIVMPNGASQNEICGHTLAHKVAPKHLSGSATRILDRSILSHHVFLHRMSETTDERENFIQCTLYAIAYLLQTGMTLSVFHLDTPPHIAARRQTITENATSLKESLAEYETYQKFVGYLVQSSLNIQVRNIPTDGMGIDEVTKKVLQLHQSDTKG